MSTVQMRRIIADAGKIANFEALTPSENQSDRVNENMCWKIVWEIIDPYAGATIERLKMYGAINREQFDAIEKVRNTVEIQSADLFKLAQASTRNHLDTGLSLEIANKYLPDALKVSVKSADKKEQSGELKKSEDQIAGTIQTIDQAASDGSNGNGAKLESLYAGGEQGKGDVNAQGAVAAPAGGGPAKPEQMTQTSADSQPTLDEKQPPVPMAHAETSSEGGIFSKIGSFLKETWENVKEFAVEHPVVTTVAAATVAAIGAIAIASGVGAPVGAVLLAGALAYAAAGYGTYHYLNAKESTTETTTAVAPAAPQPTTQLQPAPKTPAETVPPPTPAAQAPVTAPVGPLQQPAAASPAPAAESAASKPTTAAASVVSASSLHAMSMDNEAFHTRPGQWTLENSVPDTLSGIVVGYYGQDRTLSRAEIAALVKELARINGIKDPNHIRAGQSIFVPADVGYLHSNPAR